MKTLNTFDVAGAVELLSCLPKCRHACDADEKSD